MKRVKTPELGTDAVRVYFDADLNEYQVRVIGKPAATYFTDDRKDAMATAQAMRNTLLGS